MDRWRDFKQADWRRVLPRCFEADTLASTAAQWMQAQGISQVIVMQDDAYLGMVHIHDCLREGLV